MTPRVAGGGTGDATIWLAWQLKTTDAVIIHLDISEASIEVAKARARTLASVTAIKQLSRRSLSIPG